jgi:hypothetical protein
MTLVERIKAAMDSDMDDCSENLQWWYDNSTDAEQRAVDRAFTFLCGWSLKTCIRATGEPTHDDEDPDYDPFFTADGPVNPPLPITREVIAQTAARLGARLQAAHATGDDEAAARIGADLQRVRSWRPTT